MRRRGVTIIFISHDLTAVQKLCDQAILLEKGRVVASGPPSVVIADYHRSLTTVEISRGTYGEIASEGALKITNLMLWDAERPEATSLRTGNPLAVSLRYSATRRIDGIVFEITYYSNDTKSVLSTARTETGVSVMPPGGVVQFDCSELGFRPGSYYVGAVARLASSGEVIDWWDGGTVPPRRLRIGRWPVPHAAYVVASARCGGGRVRRAVLRAGIDLCHFNRVGKGLPLLTRLVEFPGTQTLV